MTTRERIVQIALFCSIVSFAIALVCAALARPMKQVRAETPETNQPATVAQPSGVWTKWSEPVEIHPHRYDTVLVQFRTNADNNAIEAQQIYDSK